MSKSKITETLWVTNKSKIALALARIVLQPNVLQPVTFKRQNDLDLARHLHEQGVIELSTFAGDSVEYPKEINAKEEVTSESKTLTEEEIKGMSKKALLEFLKESNVELEGVHSRTGATEVTNAVLVHFGFEPIPADAE
jgi:hypothetical protein